MLEGFSDLWMYIRNLGDGSTRSLRGGNYNKFVGEEVIFGWWRYRKIEGDLTSLGDRQSRLQVRVYTWIILFLLILTPYFLCSYICGKKNKTKNNKYTNTHTHRVIHAYVWCVYVFIHTYIYIYNKKLCVCHISHTHTHTCTYIWLVWGSSVPQVSSIIILWTGLAESSTGASGLFADCICQSSPSITHPYTPVVCFAMSLHKGGACFSPPKIWTGPMTALMNRIWEAEALAMLAWIKEESPSQVLPKFLRSQIMIKTKWLLEATTWDWA